MKCLVKNRIKGIIFDLDGVLVESKEWHQKAFMLALSKYGYELDKEECYIDGLSTKELLTELSRHGKCPTNLHDVWDKKQKITKQIVNKECKKNSRIYDVIKFAHEFTEGNIAVATNCSKETANLILAKLGIDSFFKSIVTSGDVNKRKPSAIPYVQAAYDIGVPPPQCLAIDDSEIGIRSAMEAKCRFYRLSNFEELTVERLEKILKGMEIRI